MIIIINLCVYMYIYICIYIYMCAYTVIIATIDQSTPRLLAPAPIRYLAVSILCFTFSFRSPYQNNVLRSEDTGLIGFAWNTLSQYVSIFDGLAPFSPMEIGI